MGDNIYGRRILASGAYLENNFKDPIPTIEETTTSSGVSTHYFAYDDPTSTINGGAMYIRKEVTTIAGNVTTIQRYSSTAPVTWANRAAGGTAYVYVNNIS